MQRLDIGTPHTLAAGGYMRDVGRQRGKIFKKLAENTENRADLFAKLKRECAEEGVPLRALQVSPASPRAYAPSPANRHS
jgi:hypothetical protein